jgi:hypothetical protein
LVSSYGIDASYDASKMARVLVPKVHINKKLTLE